MSYLLDTNVVSLTASTRPDPVAASWLKSVDVRQTGISVVTLSELIFGAASAPDQGNRDRLLRWIDKQVLPTYAGKLVPVSQEIASTAGFVGAAARRAGRPMSAFDAVLAATAQHHGMTLVTRNIRDFEVWGGPLLNPWNPA